MGAAGDIRGCITERASKEATTSETSIDFHITEYLIGPWHVLAIWWRSWLAPHQERLDRLERLFWKPFLKYPLLRLHDATHARHALACSDCPPIPRWIVGGCRFRTAASPSANTVSRCYGRQKLARALALLARLQGCLSRPRRILWSQRSHRDWHLPNFPSPPPGLGETNSCRAS